MNDLYASFVLELTDEQREILEPYLFSIKPGEAIIAQPFGDGMRMRKLPAAQAAAVNQVFGGHEHVTNSAHVAQARAVGRKLQ
jgi:hypothetical protein